MADTTPLTVLFSDNVAGIAASGTTVTYTLVFSQQVSGLEVSDFTVSNGTVGAVSGSGTNWTVSVMPASHVASGTLGLTLKAGAVQDGTGRANALQIDNSQAIDTLAPSAPRLLAGAAFKSLQDPQVTLQTSLGNVMIELDTSKAPITVANMLAYTQDGFYGDTLFHRVIDGFMVQGGGLTTGMVTKTPTYNPIVLESNNGLTNLRGTVAMARTSSPDTATSQFFVNLVDNSFLNYASATSPGYAVFGKVVTGMEVIDSMAGVTTTSVGAYANVPVTDILTKSATQTLLGRSISNTGTLTISGLESGGHFDYSLDGGVNWLAGKDSSFTVPVGSYAAGAIQVRQVDAAGNQSATVTRFFYALTVDPANNVSPNHSPTGHVRVTGVATLGQALTADISALSDADGPGNLASPNYQWLKGGEFIAGATAATYVLGASDVGVPISVRVSYTDGLGRVENLMSMGETLYGDALPNLLTGSEYNDALFGQGGNDTLDGGLGADTLTGGTGNDVFVVDNVNDVVVENAGEGTDEIRSSVSLPILLSANVENLTLTGSAGIYGIGNGLGNVITGNAGNNMLMGLGGNDTLMGEGGADTAYYLNDTAGVRVNLAQGAAQDGFGNADVLVGIENVTGSTFDDTLTGDGGANYLRGYGGNDILSGGGGNDTLDGGDGTDEATYAGAQSAYTVTKTTTGFTVAGAEGTDTLMNIERLVFADATQTLTKTVDVLAYSWKAHTLLEGVAISDGTHSASTNASGAASLTDISAANLSLTATRAIPAAEAAATSGAVNLQDAIAILKMIVGLDVNGNGKPLSPYQALAADFDGNGTVDLTDSIGVLKHVVGLTSPEPTWHFVNERDTSVPGKANLNPGVPLTTANADLGGGNPVHMGLVGYVSGDVDGSDGGLAGALDLDNTQTSYFQNLTTATGLSLSQFGL